MKVALCFIINYDHILNKEHIWRKWIDHNKDIINVYFYYKDIRKIKSDWILKHALPTTCIYETSYYNVIPAYISIMQYALTKDIDNQWFCLLTESWCPIISPKKFRYLFFNKYNKSILNWKPAWWNIDFHKRSNLALIPKELRLGNDPYFILKREDVINCLRFIKQAPHLSNLIIKGGLANESIFAIALKCYNQLDNVICKATHMADWTRMATSTSPYLFKHVCDTDTQFIENNKHNKYTMFIRKIAPDFPDNLLEKYIYKYSKQEDDMLKIVYPTGYYKKNMLLAVEYIIWISAGIICGIGLGAGIIWTIVRVINLYPVNFSHAYF